MDETEDGRDISGEGGLIRRLQTELEIMQRHVHMLHTIKAHEPIGIIRLAELLRHPQHKIRYSLRMLEKEGLIKPTPEGAICTPEAEKFIFDLDEAIADAIAHMKRIRRMVRDSL